MCAETGNLNMPKLQQPFLQASGQHLLPGPVLKAKVSPENIPQRVINKRASRDLQHLSPTFTFLQNGGLRSATRLPDCKSTKLRCSMLFWSRLGGKLHHLTVPNNKSKVAARFFVFSFTFSQHFGLLLTSLLSLTAFFFIFFYATH